MKPLSKKKILSWSLLFVVVVIVFLEVAATLFQSSRGRSVADGLFHPAYRTYFFYGNAFKPNSGGKWQAMPELKVNSLGFVGEEVSIEKPKGVYRIAAFGGSTSVAFNYPQKMQDYLNSKHPQKQWEVINAATPGWNTTVSLIQFVTRAIYMNPDLIVIYHAINDHYMIDNHWVLNPKEVNFKDYANPLLHYSHAYVLLHNRFLRLVEKLKDFAWVRKVKQMGEDSEKPARDLASTTSTQVYESNIQSFVAIAKSRGIDVMLVTMPLNYDPNRSWKENARLAGRAYPEEAASEQIARVAQYNQLMRDLAKKHKIGVADVAASNFNKDSSHFVDLCHFSEPGAVKFASMVGESIATKR